MPDATAIVVTNKQARLVQLGDLVSLRPGANTIDPEAWEKFKGTVVVRSLLREKLLVVGKVVDASVPASLAKLRPVEAIKLVAETLDRKQIERWADAEERAPIVAALREQLTKLREAAGAPAGEGAEGAAEA